MKILIKSFVHILFFLIPVLAFSQGIVKGKVSDATTGEPLYAVEIQSKELNVGCTTDKLGSFSFAFPTETTYLTIRYLGYRTKKIPMPKDSNEELFIALEPIDELLEEVILIGINDIVKDRQTPIAVSTIKSKEITATIGTKDFPQLLNSTPSVYATKEGGGFGDARISVRGFDQSNTAVLINGMPVNDMESGNVFWSNWLGMEEVTNAIQIQRGLGSSKLAIPSVGGTINILTKPAAKNQGATITFDLRNNAFTSYTVNYNTGLLENGLAASILLRQFSGDGYIDTTYGEGYGFYFDVSYQLNKRNKLQFTALSSPQWHNQRNNAISIADFIRFGGSTEKPNIRYNSEWGYKAGEAFTWSKNYYHKPIASLNWKWDINSNSSLSTMLYAAWGKGGGTLPIGNINDFKAFNTLFTDSTTGQYRFDDVVAWNAGQNVSDFGTQRLPDEHGIFSNHIGAGLTRAAFMNSQAWYGSILSYNANLSDKISLVLGADLRTHSGSNAFTTNDVLGADNYLSFLNINEPFVFVAPSDFVEATYNFNAFKSIEDLKKIVFYYQSNVKWLGGFGQLEYKNNYISSFVQASLSNQLFQRVDFFNLPKDVDGDGSIEPQESDWENRLGGTLKAGINYKLNAAHNIYFNAGYFSKQPHFEGVFINFSNIVSENIQNEKVLSFETGYSISKEFWEANFNLYHTNWSDRYVLISDRIEETNVTGRAFGVKENHSGLELDTRITYKNWLLKGALSIGNWYYNNDIKNVKLFDDAQQLVTTQDYYLKDLKVGNTGQFTANYGLVYKINKNWQVNLNHFFVSNLYASIDLASFNTPEHQGSLKLPSYDLVDLGTSYSLNVPKLGVLLFQLSVDNLFNKTYISESSTNFFSNSDSSTWRGINTENRVFFGWGRSWSLKTKFKF